MAHWLDKYIKEQRVNTDIMNKVAAPLTPAELQEMAEREGWEENQEGEVS